MAIENISLVGGHITLDFVNTVGDHLSAQPGEYLTSYSDLALWAAHAGVITQDHAARRISLSEVRHADAEHTLARAIETRETIYRLLLSAIRKHDPNDNDLAAFNTLLANAPGRTEITFANGHFQWQLAGDAVSLDDPLWHIVWAAADLLTADQMAQVKICEGEECGWLFLDTSRNQARRWCSMADCGNRAKANRYYKRHKGDR